MEPSAPRSSSLEIRADRENVLRFGVSVLTSLNRERLTRRFEEFAQYSVTLVVAPAGYGKSYALRHSFSSDSALLVEVDERTNSVESFLSYLVQVAVPRQSRGFANLLERTTNDLAVDELVPWVAARLRSFEKTIIVDDFHRLSSDERIPAMMERLIEATRHSVSWVLSSRETPELPVGTWIARQWMQIPLTAEDLQFRSDEAFELAKLLGIEITLEDVAGLVEDTGGWPIALQLALNEWARSRARLPTGMRSREVLFSYIDEQVWSTLTQEHQELLEVAALLPEADVSVIGAVGFVNPGNVLQRLARQITFIQRTEAGGFRLHDVFREFINERHRLDHSRFREVAKRIANALSQLGLSSEALRFFITIKAEEEIVAMLELVGYALIETGSKSIVSSALATLTGQLREHSVACALRGYIQMMNGAYSTAEADMRRALGGNASARFRPQATRHLAAFLLNRVRYKEAVELLEELLSSGDLSNLERLEARADLACALGYSGNRLGALAHAAAVMDHMADVPYENRPLVLNRIASATYVADRPTDAEGIANEAVTLALELGLDSLAARTYSLLYMIASMTHQGTERAEFYARSMKSTAEQAGDRLLLVSGLERLLYTATLRGDDETITVTEMELAKLGEVRLLAANLTARIGRVMRAVTDGHFAQAKRLLETIDTRDISSSEESLRLALYAVCCIANGDIDAATKILDKTLLSQLDTGFVERRNIALARVFRALGQWMLGRQQIARRSVGIDESTLTESDRILVEAIISICGTQRAAITDRTVHQLTEPLVALGLGGQARFLRGLVATHFTPARLTRAELQLLNTWRIGDTVYEVAERLGKSVNTINTQMGGIYRKTGTSGRAEAIAFARENGLITD